VEKLLSEYEAGVVPGKTLVSSLSTRSSFSLLTFEPFVLGTEEHEQKVSPYMEKIN
jgi:hypothetical protein